MSHSSSSSLRLLFNAALQDYANQTGAELDEHPLAKQLESCDTVDSITSLLQEHARKFHEFRGEDGKIMKSLKCAVHVLYTLSTSTALGEGIGLPFPPAKAVFAAFAILLAAVKDVSASYDALIDLLESIESFLGRLDIYTRIPITAAMKDIIIKIIVEVLATLALATRQVKQGRLKKFIKKILGENEIEAVLQRLDRLTLDEARATGAQTLEVVCGLVQHRRLVMDDLDDKASENSIRTALELLQKISSDINKSKRDELQQNIRKWLSPPDPWKNHNIARESRHSGTATWWTHGETFPKWKHSGPSSLLWIHGKPGAGKSVLCSSIIQDIRGMCALGLASLAFFYCDFREDKKKDCRGLLSSLLVQLCGQSDAYYAALSQFYFAHGHGSQHASDGELVQFLKHLLELPDQATVYVVIDALDECPTTTGLPSPREEVLKLVKELVGLHLPNLRICVTSRSEADIEPILGPLAFRSVSLHGESGQAQDIEEYIRFVVNTDPKMRAWRAGDKELVIETLTKKADGMFRWVFCQLVYLRHCLPQRIRRALNELPPTLDATYERTLQDISEQNWEFARRLFHCVAAASRPLRVKELAEFLAFEFDEVGFPTYLPDWRPEDPVSAVLSTCPSLLIMVNDYDIPIIQFSHFSVKEYLTSKRLSEAKDTISRFHVSMSAAHTIIAQACLGVLLHFDETITQDDLEEFPLTMYAVKHWPGHARFKDVSRSIEDGVKCLFGLNNRHFSILARIYDPVSHECNLRKSKHPLGLDENPLHYAAFYGLHDIAKFLIVEHSQDVNARCRWASGTPLGIASMEGHSEVARLLLERGADMEKCDIEGYSPFVQASRMGHVEVVQVFLEYGVDVNIKDDNHNTPLHVASEFYEAATARVLLEHNADPNAKGRRNKTPLHYAEHEEFARVLLAYGADTNARDNDNSTPLHCAEDEGVARVLLEYGADANARDNDNSTPLHRAENKGVARVLLEYGADINARDNDYWTPLHYVKTEGVARLLLECGADTNARDSDNSTPLHCAENEGVSRVLLEFGADMNARDNDNSTPLHYAKTEGVARLLLLECGADANARDSDNSTPLHRAKNEGIARVLLEYGADANARDSNNLTPLHQAKNEGVARVLLGYGADAKAQDRYNSTPLHEALDYGRTEVARVLLENGADANARNSENRTPLHVASREGYPYSVWYLLQHSSDIHARDDKGQTPFQVATENGHESVMELLLEHGAEDHRTQ